jgi:hypothetical protein
MKEEEERRISQHLASLASSETAFEVEQAQDRTLEDVQEMDDMRMGIRNQASRKTSAPASLSSGSHMLHTAKGERRFREKIEREGGIENYPADEQAAIAEALDES